MKVFSWDDVIQNKLDSCFLEKGTALTVGVFDGIHIGHKELLKAVLKGQEQGYFCGVVTFTDKIFSLYKSNVEPIESLEKRLNRFEQLGFDFVILIDFTGDIASMDGNDFLQSLMDFCNVKLLVEGEDFRFGSGGKTGKKEIQAFCSKYNINCVIIPPVIWKGERVSSTLIRRFLKEGDQKSVSELM